MLKDLLGEALPLVEKFAPAIATLFGLNAPLITIEIVKILAEVFKPDANEFTIGELEKRILNHADHENLLADANKKAIQYLKDTVVITK